MRGEEDVEDNEDDEGEEGVVILWDAGSADMRAGAALRDAAASAAATAGRMKAISTGSRLGAGGCKGPASIWRTWVANVVGSGVWRRRRGAVSTVWARPGRAPRICEGVNVSVRGGKQFAWSAFGRRGGRS